MPIVEFSESDLLRGKLLPPAWYLISVDEVKEWEPSKDRQSNNCIMECTVIKNADNGQTEGIAGVPLMLQFNDKKSARGFIEGFLRALGVEVEATRYDLANAKGKTVEAFVENNEFEGRVRNRVNHKYRKPRE